MYMSKVLVSLALEGVPFTPVGGCGKAQKTGYYYSPRPVLLLLYNDQYPRSPPC